MSNVKRKCKPNYTYHTFSRCINKQKLMKPDYMKDLMLKVMNMALSKYKFELISYTIMDNHFHFFIRTLRGGPNISRIMQFIKSQYAQRYNKKMNRCGPFWNERFKDTIVEIQKNPEKAFLYINNYILCNPVRARYVCDARKYKYGCFEFFINKDYKPPVKLTYHEYFLKQGRSFKERVKKILELEEMYIRKIFPDYAFEMNL